MGDGIDCGARNQSDAVAEVVSYAAQQECAEECFLDECDRDRREKIFRDQLCGRFMIAYSAAADRECEFRIKSRARSSRRRSRESRARGLAAQDE